MSRPGASKRSAARTQTATGRNTTAGGPGARHVAHCPALPPSPRYEPDRLLNHALFTDALPGSIVKPIMATGFMRDPLYRKKIAAERVSTGFLRLQDELKGSDSVAFLNRMFCA